MKLFRTIREILQYVRKGRTQFHEVARERESEAEEQYQRSIRSAIRVNSAARRVKHSSDFIREVLRGNHG